MICYCYFVNKAKQKSIAKAVSNIFGVSGYLICSMQWLWFVLLYFSLIDRASSFFISQNSNQPIINIQSTTNNSPDIFAVIFMGIIIVLMIVLTVYCLIKIPLTIVKSGSKVVNETAENLAPIILNVQKKKDTKTRRFKLSVKLAIIAKSSLITLPLILSLSSKLLDKQMVPYEIAFYASLWLFGLSLISFVVQYLFAKIFYVSYKELL